MIECSEQQIYAILTGRLSELMVLFPENKSSKLLHPGWRRPILVSQSHCRREVGITDETMLASGFFFRNDGKQFLERSSARSLWRSATCNADIWIGSVPRQQIGIVTVASWPCHGNADDSELRYCHSRPRLSYLSRHSPDHCTNNSQNELFGCDVE